LEVRLAFAGIPRGRGQETELRSRLWELGRRDAPGGAEPYAGAGGENFFTRPHRRHRQAYDDSTADPK
jgi:hypothetical protein